MAAKSIQESIEFLEEKRRKTRDEIDLRKLIVKKFPNAVTILDRIEDGSLCYICDGVNPSNSTGVKFIYHPVHNYFLIRPFLLISRKKAFTKLFSPNAYKVSRSQVLEALNLYGSGKKIAELPKSYQSLFGAIFSNENEQKIDTAFQIASEHAVPEPEVKDNLTNS